MIHNMPVLCKDLCASSLKVVFLCLMIYEWYLFHFTAPVMVPLSWTLNFSSGRPLSLATSPPRSLPPTIPQVNTLLTQHLKCFPESKVDYLDTCSCLSVVSLHQECSTQISKAQPAATLLNHQSWTSSLLSNLEAFKLDLLALVFSLLSEALRGKLVNTVWKNTWFMCCMSVIVLLKWCVLQ